MPWTAQALQEALIASPAKPEAVIEGHDPPEDKPCGNCKHYRNFDIGTPGQAECDLHGYLTYSWNTCPQFSSVDDNS